MRYKKAAVIVFVLLVMLFFGGFFASQTHPAYAQGNPTMIPKSWGSCKGGWEHF